MPYSNYSFVIDSTFRPFTMQEMLTPLAMYKDAFEKTEEAYVDLSNRADKFKYLADNLDPDSKAAQIYNGYANDLKAQAEDLAHNGLSMANRRALTGLRRRYQGEIGRLVDANAKLQQEVQLRRQMAAKDPSMLYATDNISIDDYLDNNTPNLYGISGNDLYARGAAAGKATSSRIYSAGDAGSTLGGYYRNWIEKNGYSKESMDAFRANAAAIPELQKAADDILFERGVNENLTGANLARARQSVLNGIIDGAVYTEKVNPVRDPGVMSAQERAADARAQESLQMQKEKFSMEKQNWEDERRLRYTFDESGNIVGFNPSYVSSDYEMTPDGKWRKKSATSQSPEEKKALAAENKKGTELLKLKKEDLAHNEGFDVTFGDDRHHYDYAGAVSKHDGKWKSGAIGEDVSGRGWGFTSSSNVMSKWGNYSAEGSDSKDMRVLSPSEVEALLIKEPEIMEALDKQVEDYKKKNNYGDNVDFDIQLVEVPNEKDSKKKGYLIAIR